MPPDAFDLLVVYMPACVVLQTNQHTISVAPLFVDQLDDIVGQLLFIAKTLRRFPLRRLMLSKYAARYTLGYAQLLTYMVDEIAMTSRA